MRSDALVISRRWDRLLDYRLRAHDANGEIETRHSAAVATGPGGPTAAAGGRRRGRRRSRRRGFSEDDLQSGVAALYLKSASVTRRLPGRSPGRRTDTRSGRTMRE